MEVHVCCEQEETVPILYSRLVVLGCSELGLIIYLHPHSASLKRSELPALFSTNTPLLHFIYLCRYREVEADLPHCVNYCDLTDLSCTQVSLD